MSKTKIKVPKETKVKKRRHYTQKEVFKKYGIRSGLEDIARILLEENEIKFEYETLKINYTIPQSLHSYKPDFVFPNKDNPKMIIETKGRWMPDDRKKMKLIKEQNPNLDIRMVFSNANTKITKKSKTTYGDICNKLGIKFADKTIPEEWLEEIKKII
jgi:hypothetical protein